MVAASKPTSWLSEQPDPPFHLVRNWGPELRVWAVSLSTTKLIPGSLTANAICAGIRSLFGFGNQVMAPSPFSALPPAHFFVDAAPKCISRRTSYIRVRLAFHRYPQFIRRVFNRGRFGLPRGFTRASP